MYNRLMRLGFIVTAVVVFAAGCAPSQAALPAATTVSSPAAAPTAVSPAPTAASAVSPLATPPTASGSLTSNAIRFALVPEKSEARFRVREQLANASLPNDAIGRTREFTGTIVVKPDGTIVPSDSKFVVNLGTLTSDRSQRDNYIKRNVLQTNQYPNAVFVPTQVTGLSSPLPQSGAVSFKLIGDFTIQNVTKPVTWDVTGQVQGNEFTGQATTSFKFEDFGLTQPRVAVVLSVEDHIQLELDLDLQRMN